VEAALDGADPASFDAAAAAKAVKPKFGRPLMSAFVPAVPL
jgi:hypothetical protein